MNQRMMTERRDPAWAAAAGLARALMRLMVGSLALRLALTAWILPGMALAAQAQSGSVKIVGR